MAPKGSQQALMSTVFIMTAIPFPHCLRQIDSLWLHAVSPLMPMSSVSNISVAPPEGGQLLCQSAKRLCCVSCGPALCPISHHCTWHWQQACSNPPKIPARHLPGIFGGDPCSPYPKLAGIFRRRFSPMLQQAPCSDIIYAFQHHAGKCSVPDACVQPQTLLGESSPHPGNALVPPLDYLSCPKFKFERLSPTDKECYSQNDVKSASTSQGR